MATKKGSKRGKQHELELKGVGVEPVKIKAIENAIDNYIPARDDRMAASKLESEMKEKLVDVVRANADKIGRDQKTGVVTYKSDEFILTLTPTEEELKVRKIKEKTVIDVDANE